MQRALSRCFHPRCLSSGPSGLSATLAANGVVVLTFPGHPTPSLFHGIFLRDHCETSRHPLTGQRTVDTHAIPLDIAPTHVEWEGESLRVEWPNTPQASVFSLPWLQRHSYWWDGVPPPPRAPDGKGLGALGVWWHDQVKDTRTRVVWDRSTFQPPHPSSLPSVPHQAYMESPEGLLTALRQLRDYGFFLVQGTPPTEAATEAVCRRLGFLRPTLYGPGMWRTEVLPTPGDVTDTAFTSLPLPLHTDGNYLRDPPGLQVFHCTLPDASGGGDSLLADGLAIAREVARLDPPAFQLLTLWPLHYHHTGKDGLVGAARPVFELGEDGEVCGFFFNNDDRGPVVSVPSWGREVALANALRGGGGGGGGATTGRRVREGMGGGVPDTTTTTLLSATLAHPSTAMPALYSALHTLLGCLRRADLTLKLPLRPGSTLVFNNHRVLHGREGFDGRSGRTLVGCYIGADEWESKLREVAGAAVHG